jgi:hypothetical protein
VTVSCIGGRGLGSVERRLPMVLGQTTLGKGKKFIKDPERTRENGALWPLDPSACHMSAPLAFGGGGIG